MAPVGWELDIWLQFRTDYLAEVLNIRPPHLEAVVAESSDLHGAGALHHASSLKSSIEHLMVLMTEALNGLLTGELVSQVKLSDDYAQYDDADEGPLARGDIGTLVEDDGSGKPYKVRSAGGKCWWYKKEAIVKAEVSFFR